MDIEGLKNIGYDNIPNINIYYFIILNYFLK